MVPVCSSPDTFTSINLPSRSPFIRHLTFFPFFFSLLLLLCSLFAFPSLFYCETKNTKKGKCPRYSTHLRGNTKRQRPIINMLKYVSSFFKSTFVTNKLTFVHP